MSARRSNRLARSRPRALPAARRGALLLIVMALLALLTLMGLTLVVATSQGRMSALAAARANAEATRDDAVADEVLNQILRGTNDSDSVLQGHSLLEDLYGPPVFYGRVASPSSPSPLDVIPLAGGQLISMNVMASSTAYPLAPYAGAYCGQVITMLDGPAQGYSSRIVGYVYYPASNYATIQVVAFDGLVPKPANPPTYLGDQFLINGRPFSGTGFGFNLANSATLKPGIPAPTVQAAPYDVGPTTVAGGPLLNAVESTLAPVNPNKPPASGMPYAYLPNHARIQLTSASVSPYYYDPSGPGFANESYDAVDFQNMLLAMHIQYGAGTLTPIPSLHRPELVAWCAQQAVANNNPAINMSGAGYPANLMRRKVVLRPEPMDQAYVPATHDKFPGIAGQWDFREPFVDLNGDQMYTPGNTPPEPFLDLNNDGAWTTGDLDYSGNQFNPITGCWYINGAVTPPVWVRDPNVIGGLDVDNDNDGVPDSIWVDAGLPVQIQSDGTQYKWLTAILCIDMDGKINLNAHGTIAQADPFRYNDPEFVAPFATPSVNAPVANATYVDLANNQTYNLANNGQIYPMYSQSGIVQRVAPIGQGYGPAEINPVYLLSRIGGGTITVQTLNYYTNLLMGYAYYDYTNSPPNPFPVFRYSVDGKYGESSRIYLGSTYLGLFPPSDDNSPYPNPAVTAPGYTFRHYLLGGPRPGWSRWIDPWMTHLTYTSTVINPSSSTGGKGWDWVNDATTLARLSDVRPFLLNPAAQLLPVTVPYPSPSFLVPQYFDYIAPNLLANSLVAPYENASLHVPTAHGTPYDLLARGMVTTDLRGTPYYAGTQTLPWMANLDDPALFTPPAASPDPTLQDAYLSYLNDAIDSPYELDLSANAQHTGRNTGNLAGSTGSSTPDAPFAPAEMESLLRVNDSDAADFRKRLDQLETIAVANAQAPPSPPSSTPLPTASSLAKLRLSLTTESWDLPVASVALTPQQMRDVATFNNIFSGTTWQLNLSGLSLTDLARARIISENSTNAAYTAQPSSADTALFGNLPGAIGSGNPVWPLLSSEVVMGMRLDINRLLGNGQDDNGNGVVDEPLEAVRTSGGVVQTEWLTYPWSPNKSLANPSGSENTMPNVYNGLPIGMNNTEQWLDLNNDGLLPMVGVATPLTQDPQYPSAAALGDPTLADMRARQLLARHLYVTMMLLLDDRSNGLTQNLMANSYLVGAAQPPWNSLGANSRVQAAYLIAQWAINAVDFRDRDSIMTPFEFDIYPFRDDDGNVFNGTWDVDDIVDPSGGVVLPGSKQDDSNPLYNNPLAPIRGIVWGCERPELLITETIATHDRGTDDTDKGEPLAGGSPDTYTQATTVPKDNDYDQVRRPRGSLILELFNATNPADAPQRDLQYDPILGALAPPQEPWQALDLNGNGGYGVNLAQIATAPAAIGGGPTASPVWRVVIAYSPNYDESTFYTNAPPFVTGKQTPGLDPRVPIVPAAYIHRAAYFAPYRAAFMTAGGAMMNEISSGRSFFLDPGVFVNPANGGALMLPPSQYAVVGPAAPDATGINAIYLGENAKDALPNSNYLKLQLGDQTNHNTFFSSGNYSTNPPTPNAVYAPGNIKPVIGVPIQTTWLNLVGGAYVYLPRTAGPPTTTLRMSVSEPDTGYPLWPTTGGGSTWDDATYYATTPPAAPAAGIPNFPNTPFDNDTTLKYLKSQPNPYVAPNGTNNPAMTPCYTVIYLQRLANPLSPWDALANPYITVDSMPVDLTAYTGENQPQSDPVLASATEPTYATGKPGTINAFTTRRRGYDPVDGTKTLFTVQAAANCWTPLPTSQTFTAGQFGINNGDGSLTNPLPSTGANHATLGYLNSEYGTYYSAGAAPVGSSGVNSAVYNGDPITPFPWITWNNRPYVSQYELMLVPVSSPASLCSDFDMVGWQGNLNALPTPIQKYAGLPANQYQPVPPPPVAPTSPAPPPLVPGQLPVAQFRHLLNFYDSQQPINTSSGTFMPNLYRIFEHVHVPSRFAGTQTMLTPFPFESGNSGSAAHFFHPPFNWVSSYREPGKMNINTIFDNQAFEGLMDAYPGWASLWQQVIDSRQGFNAAGNSIVPNWRLLWNPDATGKAQNSVLPTIFANPFRPDGAGALVPQASMTTSVTPPTSPLSLMHSWNYPGTATNNYYGVNTTLLRAGGAFSDPGTTESFATTITPLFDDSNFDPNNLAATTNFGLASSQTQFRHAGRNAYFQYQALQRMGNLVTNRSNVYAVWITLGKFQVQRVPIGPNNPDGYQLVSEVGSDTGEIERKRSFYLIDRSIPVGFSRGQNLNVERTVLVERVLDE